MNPDDILRMADECEESAQVWAHEIDTRKRAAAELRRLHAQVAQDEALLRQALAALEQARRELRVVWTTTTPEIIDAIAALRERLAETADDLTRCPNCGGPADNGHDREVPPSPYWCSKCTES